MRYCVQPGCPNKVQSGRCKDHEKVQQAHYSRFKRGATAYNRAAWIRRRDVFIVEHPFCINAGNDPRCTQVTEVVDHIEPHRGDPAKFSGPLQPMCWSCHSRKVASEVRLGHR